MKYKTLTKGGSTYYRKLKTLIPIKGKYEKDFLNTILQNLESICSEQPAITEYVIQKLRISSIIRHIVISILLIAVVVACIELYSFHKLYTQVDHSIDGYSIETPPTEVP